MLDLKKWITKVSDALTTRYTSVTGSYGITFALGKRCGIVTLTMSQSPASEITKNSWVQIGTIPEGYRPYFVYNTLVCDNSGSTSAKTIMETRIYPDGRVMLWAFADGNTNNKLYQTVTYVGGVL